MRLILVNPNLSDEFTRGLMKYFDAVATLDNEQNPAVLFGSLDSVPTGFYTLALEAEEDKTSIYFENNLDSRAPVNVYLYMKQSNSKSGAKAVVGKANIKHLWGIGHENLLPPMTDLCIVDQYRKTILSSFDLTKPLLHRITIGYGENSTRAFQYVHQGEQYFVSYFSLFLKSRFNSPNISIILRSHKSNSFAALSEFRITFPLIILLTVWIVLFLSISHIRKSLTPLEKIKEGTLRVARQDFKQQVVVKSNDEFEDVAASFNYMSNQINRQFEALAAMSEIDRTILSSLNTKKIINTALKRLFSFFSCDSTSLNLTVEKNLNTFHSYILNDIEIRRPVEDYFEISGETRKFIKQNSNHIVLNRQDNNFSLLISKKQAGDFCIVLPLFLDKGLKGTIVLGFLKEWSIPQTDLEHARQIADQVLIALSNSTLVEDLERLNIGTLEALARTVDAKSTWTAGHSERVTDLSIKIARVLGYNRTEIDVLQRAAFLHDIGKIGVPSSILDKPDRLTDEEFKLIKEHPLIGWRILEPIETYSDVLHIIAQHHEKFNGKGYPFGISGDEIVLGARILAVADVYDAVISDRPYRDGWVKEKAVNMIKEEAGKHFDPMVVDAFLSAV